MTRRLALGVALTRPGIDVTAETLAGSLGVALTRLGVDVTAETRAKIDGVAAIQTDEKVVKLQTTPVVVPFALTSSIRQ